MRRTFAVSVLLVVVARLGAAPPERTHTITPADYAHVKMITEVALSPSGKEVAFILATWDQKTDRRHMQLWVVATDGQSPPKQLTNDNAGDSHPKWSADGQAIYTLAKRGGDKAKPQVWKIPLDGQPVAVTDAHDGVVHFDYAPQADTIFYTIDAKTTDHDHFTPLREKYPKIDYGHGRRTVSELYAIPNGQKPKKVLADNRYIREFAVTPDGKRLAMITALDDSVVKSEGESRVDIWDNGRIVTPPTDLYRAKAASPYAWLENLAWNPDGTRFAFCCIHDAYPAEIILGHQADGQWTTTRLDRQGQHIRGYGSPLKWHSPTLLCYLTDERGCVNFAATDVVTGQRKHLRSNSNVIYAFDVPVVEKAADTLPIALVRGGSDAFPNLCLFHYPDRLIDLTDINPQTKTWKLPTIQHITWKAPDGTTVGGPLELPFGWKKGDKPLPLVVAIHGGPTTASYNDLRFDPHNGRLYFAAAGYAVLCPNYRGSTGYGDPFLTDLVGRENDLDVKDILAGIQHLIHEGIADPERIAVMGWSNGGYLTNCLITLKNPPVKIKAASSGAGILDTVAEWGFNDEPAYPMVFKKGLPWEQPEMYKKTSPTYGLGHVTTPTIIHVGANDVRCPPGHSRMLYRALREYLNVPTELCEYPNQPHGLGTLTFRTAKMEWDLAWFAKYLHK
ncbi:MAG: prolyl oligopeptidase family serine peptidase [Gemmataceae bacterium]|nr:prolyl oligopeptidase family serine peptidase [Gemmata sp.]MDW8197275.1 prolyl oligopeptidase family serine peptidase [Gemmataceae bacterium]